MELSEALKSKSLTCVIPYARIGEMLRGARYKQGLTKAPIEYFKVFYYDTAIYGNTPGLMCAHAFCGTEHMLFGTDMPYDSQFGERYTRQKSKWILAI